MSQTFNIRWLGVAVSFALTNWGGVALASNPLILENGSLTINNNENINNVKNYGERSEHLGTYIFMDSGKRVENTGYSSLKVVNGVVNVIDSKLDKSISGNYISTNSLYDQNTLIQPEAENGQVNISGQSSVRVSEVSGNHIDVQRSHSFVSGGSVNINVGNNESVTNVQVSLVAGNRSISWVGPATAVKGVLNVHNAKLSVQNPNSFDELKHGFFGNFVQSAYQGDDDWIRAEDGTVEIYTSTVEGNITGNHIFGGGAQNASSSQSRVIISQSPITGDIRGGRVYYAVNAKSNDGYIAISESVVKGSVYVGHIDAMQSLESNNNEILITKNTSITGDVIGAMLNGRDGFEGDKSSAQNSSILISESKVNGNVYGTYIRNRGNTESIANRVEVFNSVVNGSITGGYSNSYNTSGYVDPVAIAKENVIILSGNSDVRDVLVAYADALHGGSVQLVDNSIILKNGSDVKMNEANLMGYDYKLDANSQGNITIHGNKLLIDNWTGTVNSINNFNEIGFQNLQWRNGGTILEVLNNEKTSDLQESIINISRSTSLQGGEKLQVGDFMYFLLTDSKNNFKTDETRVNAGGGIFTAGVAFEGQGKVVVEANGNVKYVVTDVHSSDQAEEVPERVQVGQAFILQTYDLVVDGLNAIERDQHLGTKFFAIGEGAYSRYDVDEKLKIQGWNGMVGAGRVNEGRDKNLAWALFFEFGDANARFWYNIGEELHRSDTQYHYRGGGLALRQRYNNGWYWDGSTRLGMIYTKAENAFMNGRGDFFDHNQHTTYASAHLGFGRIVSLKNYENLDLFARVFYTHFEEQSFSIDKDHFKLDDVDSLQLRTGGRWTFQIDQPLNYYFGGAFEYEFKGDSNGSVNDYSLKESSLAGATGYGEFGFNYGKAIQSSWSFEGHIRGYIGVRDGISGLLRATYTY